MKKLIINSFLSFMFSFPLFSKEISTASDSVNLKNSSLISINNVSMWVNSDGVLAKNPMYNAIKGMVYPKGTANVVYADGFLWGGFVHDGYDPLLRVGGSIYTSGLQPGSILSRGVAEQVDSSTRSIWNIRRDWETADLTETAKILFNYTDTANHPTVDEINKVRKMYRESWETWPWQKGAPFYDDNKNGIMDPGEKPGLLNADQVVWFVCNDLDSLKCRKLFLDSPPVGMELQVTLWAYNREGTTMGEALKPMCKALKQSIFRRYRFIYKGTEQTPDSAYIDSMFITLWSDCDIGNYTDDYVGCDTLLDLMFGYNSENRDEEFHEYHLRPPAIGYSLLQGPAVFTGNSNDRALCASGEKSLYKNLNMSAFTYFAVQGTGFNPDVVLYAQAWYNLMNDLCPLGGTPFLNSQGNPDHFPLSDDPSEGGLDVDGIICTAGDRRMQFHSGPFSMAVGDTQDVVIATVGGIGSDRLKSVSLMKFWTKWVRYFYDYQLWEEFEPLPDREKKPVTPTLFTLSQNYPNPFNSYTKIIYGIPVESKVKIDVYNNLGKYIKTIVNEPVPAGIHTIKWDASLVASGIYLCRMKAGKVTRTIKMIVVR